MKVVVEDSIRFEIKEFDDSVFIGFSDEIRDDVIDFGYGLFVFFGVVKEGEIFDFCMCNSLFFESMKEVGLNLKIFCGGIFKEMVCLGGERVFISSIIEDSVILKKLFRYRIFLWVSFGYI